MSDATYVVVTPAHNESDNLPEVIESIAGQKLLPSKWVIVNDRSTDDTWAILEAAANKHAFIEVARISGEPDRRVGANVVSVVNEGLKKISREAEYLVKLDADVTLPADYFYQIVEHFKDDAKLGMASGKTYTKNKDRWVLERIPDMHVSGACKTYRLSCFEDIGGLLPLLGWDILDCAKARMQGWKTRSYRDLLIYHLRPSGSARGMLRSRLRSGLAMYTIRAHPLFVLGKALHRSFEKPYMTGMLIPLGYLGSFFTRAKRLNDPKLARFIRKEQLRRLFGMTLAHEALFPRYLRKR